MPIPLGPPRPLKPMPYQPHPIVMRPIFIDAHTGEIIDHTPPTQEKEKPFSDILKKKK